MPGKFSQNDIAKKIYKILVDEVGDRAMVKSIASTEKDCYDAAARRIEGEYIMLLINISDMDSHDFMPKIQASIFNRCQK